MAATDRDGFYRKFDVRYADGRDGPEYPWFVLCYTRDPFARAALAAYADACEATLPKLARELREELSRQ